MIGTSIAHTSVALHVQSCQYGCSTEAWTSFFGWPIETGTLSLAVGVENHHSKDFSIPFLQPWWSSNFLPLHPAVGDQTSFRTAPGRYLLLSNIIIKWYKQKGCKVSPVYNQGMAWVILLKNGLCSMIHVYENSTSPSARLPQTQVAAYLAKVLLQ